MADSWKDEAWAQRFWYSGKVTRRRLLGLGATAAGALGAAMLVPAPWRDAFGQAKPYKIGSLQPLSGTAAAGGKTALVGVQMAVDRINKSGGINGRPIELLVADYESKPDVGRRKAEKLVVEDKIDAHAGGYLSNVCLACMPVYEEHKLVNMITVCLDTTITTSRSAAGTPSGRSTSPPPRRWRSRPTWSTRWARSGTSPTPTTRGASRPRTPSRPSRSRRTAARSSARRASRSAPRT